MLLSLAFTNQFYSGAQLSHGGGWLGAVCPFAAPLFLYVEGCPSLPWTMVSPACSSLVSLCTRGALLMSMNDIFPYSIYDDTTFF